MKRAFPCDAKCMPSMVSRQAVRDKHNNLIPAKRQHTYIYTMS